MKTLVCVLSTSAFLIAGGCRPAVEETTVTTSTVAGGTVPRQAGKSVPTAASTPAPTKGFAFEALVGFEERPEHNLLYNPKLRASISPAFQEGAVFEQVASEYTADNLKKQGAALKEREMKQVGGAQRLFVKCDRLNPKYPQTSVTVLFPTAKGVAQLTAIYPTELPPQDQQAIDSALLNARYVD